MAYQAANDWGAGFEGTITIENRSDQAMEDWELSFDWEEKLTNIWDADVISHEGSRYVIRNAGCNASLAAGQTLTLGFTGKDNHGGEPTEVYLKESRTDLPADTNRDIDQDGMPDALELEIGTNPFAFDTDGNGILDGAEDFDSDGLSNAEEYELKTSPHSADSDLDGLSDKEEWDRYQTEPREEETDKDGINDGDEAALEEINADNPYKLSMELTAAGVADHSLNIEESDHSELLSDNDAVVGNVVDLEYEGLKVERVSLSFTIGDSDVKNAASNYRDPGLEGIKRFQIFHYDENNATLCPVETVFHEETKTLEG